MQPNTNDDITMLARRWKVEAAPPGLAERIVANATRLPQQHSWSARMGEEIRRFIGTWSRPLMVPATVLATLLLMGVYFGQSSQPLDDESDIDAFIFDTMGDGEEL